MSRSAIEEAATEAHMRVTSANPDAEHDDFLEELTKQLQVRAINVVPNRPVEEDSDLVPDITVISIGEPVLFIDVTTKDELQPEDKKHCQDLNEATKILVLSINFIKESGPQFEEFDEHKKAGEDCLRSAGLHTRDF